MGFFNLYKPKEYNYRYIYYDPKKEAKKEREQKRQNEENKNADGEFKTSIKRGTFREMSNRNSGERTRQVRESNFRLILIILLLLAIAYFMLK